MKIQNKILYTFLFIILCIQTTSVYAYLLDEKKLATKDNACFINYLSDKNSNGWFIDIEKSACNKQGALNGYYSVIIYNGFAKPVDQLTGYFSDGYFTNNAFINVPLLTRSSTQLGVQKATFYIEKDMVNDIDYIGQMIAYNEADGAYSPFNVCNPFRILAVTENIDIFKDFKEYNPVFENIRKMATRFCSDQNKTMLFVSNKVEPEPEDILFYADIDFSDGDAKISVIDNTNERINKPKSVKYLNQPLSQKQNELSLIRESLHSRLSQLQENIPVTSTEEINKYKDEPAFMIMSDKVQDKNIYTSENSYNEDNLVESPVTDSFIEKQEKKDQIQNQKIDEKDKIVPISNLLVLSKIKKSAVLGSSIVHVSNLGNRTIIDIDKPYLMDIKGGDLSDGWYVIKGYYSTKIDPSVIDLNFYGTVDVIKATRCDEPYCQDINEQS